MRALAKSNPVLLCALAIIGCTLLLCIGIRRGRLDGARTNHAGDRAAAPPRVRIEARLQTFEERLRETENVDWKDSAALARRSSVLLEWLATDRIAALRFVALGRFKDLRLPGVAKAIGQTATPSELFAIANASDQTFESVYRSQDGVVQEW